ncbi:TetR/AcrR family transcriptional regulator [Alkalibacterium pelagium]|uniref:Transcriptional regulator, TetR family n=1 Tax=Alkalibacterium pelagium TaxID=426702 RepID=A0A1H7LDQ9_9LACT|nr:TetR/AcrR family transcriptional regulator [Alkalibacterium pelagium]GEN50910.1 TetR family transcriptional regulator [Alkalibacterium pelagium]SEK97091.1 transcriptional regulator, TetR family [Alkalibacterium pelagium]
MGRLADRDSRETREKILNEAISVFEVKGYNKTSMRDIQIKAQVSKGTIYYHFKNKEELFLCCIKKVSEESLKSWKEISSNLQSATDKLYAWTELGIIEMRSPKTKSLFEYTNQLTETEAGHEHVEGLLKNELDAVKIIIEEGKDTGEFRKDLNSHDTSVILMNLVTGFNEASLYGYKTLDEQKALGACAVRLFIEGLK